MGRNKAYDGLEPAHALPLASKCPHGNFGGKGLPQDSESIARLQLQGQEFARRTELEAHESSTRSMWSQLPKQLELCLSSTTLAQKEENVLRNRISVEEAEVRAGYVAIEAKARLFSLQATMNSSDIMRRLHDLQETETKMRQIIIEAELGVRPALESHVPPGWALVVAPPRALSGLATVRNENDDFEDKDLVGALALSAPPLHIQSRVHAHDLAEFQSAWRSSSDQMVTFSRGKSYSVDLTGDRLLAHGWDNVVLAINTDDREGVLVLFISTPSGGIELYLVSMHDMELGLPHDEYSTCLFTNFRNMRAKDLRCAVMHMGQLYVFTSTAVHVVDRKSMSFAVSDEERTGVNTTSTFQWRDAVGAVSVGQRIYVLTASLGSLSTVVWGSLHALNPNIVDALDVSECVASNAYLYARCIAQLDDGRLVVVGRNLYIISLEPTYKATILPCGFDGSGARHAVNIAGRIVVLSGALSYFVDVRNVHDAVVQELWASGCRADAVVSLRNPTHQTVLPHTVLCLDDDTIHHVTAPGHAKLYARFGGGSIMCASTATTGVLVAAVMKPTMHIDIYALCRNTAVVLLSDVESMPKAIALSPNNDVYLLTDDGFLHTLSSSYVSVLIRGHNIPMNIDLHYRSFKVPILLSEGPVSMLYHKDRLVVLSDCSLYSIDVMNPSAEVPLRLVNSILTSTNGCMYLCKDSTVFVLGSALWKINLDDVSPVERTPAVDGQHHRAYVQRQELPSELSGPRGVCPVPHVRDSAVVLCDNGIVMYSRGATTIVARQYPMFVAAVPKITHMVSPLRVDLATGAPSDAAAIAKSSPLKIKAAPTKPPSAALTILSRGHQKGQPTTQFSAPIASTPSKSAAYSTTYSHNALTVVTAPPQDFAVIFGAAIDDKLLVRGILPGSTAAAAGMRIGDTVRSINGTSIQIKSDLNAIRGSLTSGLSAEVVVFRHGDDAVGDFAGLVSCVINEVDSGSVGRLRRGHPLAREALNCFVLFVSSPTEPIEAADVPFALGDVGRRLASCGGASVKVPNAALLEPSAIEAFCDTLLGAESQSIPFAEFYLVAHEMFLSCIRVA
eukprot:PhM_4_TR8477/c1_g1_i1/m.104073